MINIGSEIISSISSFGKYLDKKIGKVQKKLENESSKIFFSVIAASNKNELNGGTTAFENSKNVIENWLDHLAVVPNEKILKLKKSLHAHDPKEFADELNQFFADLEKREQRDFATISYFFIKELRFQLVRIDPKNYISSLANLLTPGLFFAKLNRSLEKVITALDDIHHAVQLCDSNDLMERSEILEMLSEIEKQLGILEYLYTELVYKNNDSLLPYRNASYLGNIHKHFREISDIFEAIQCTISGIDDHRHLYCGCHFSYAGDVDESHQHRHPIVPLQVIDVVKSKLQLKEKVASCKNLKKKMVLENRLKRLQKNEYSTPRFKIKPRLYCKKIGSADFFHKKTVLIITCSYGGGHNCAAQAVARYLGKNGAHVEVCDLSSDVLLNTQLIHKVGNWIGKSWKYADLFNFILKYQLYKVINRWHEFDLNARWLLGMKGKSGIAMHNAQEGGLNKELIRQRLLKHMPDQIVTVYHMDLNPVLEVAEELGIPVIHLPTDVDMKAREPFEEGPPLYPHFKMFVPFDDPFVFQTAKPLQKNQLVVGGYPVRPEFLNSLSEQQIADLKQERGLDPDTKVVLLMGGNGGQHVPYPEFLANSATWSKKIHLVIIIGNNRAFAEHLKSKLTRVGNYYQGSNENVTIELAKDPATKTQQSPYYVGAQEIANLMDLSNAAISKPGGSSTAELLYKGVPTLFDHRYELFHWEEINVNFLRQAGRGLSNKSLSFFEQDLKKVLKLERQFAHHAIRGLNTRDYLHQTIAEQQDAIAVDPEVQYRRAQYCKRWLDENLYLSNEEAYEVKLNCALFSQERKTEKLLIPSVWSERRCEFKVEKYGKIETENQALRLERYKNLIFEVQLRCEKENIPFWLCCGTLLGAFRYQKQIPWDYDADAAILQKDFKKVLAILKQLEAEDPDSYEISDLSNPQDPGKFLRVWVRKSCGDGRGGAWLDIYSYEAKEDGLWFYGKRSNPEDIFPLVKVSFHEGEAWGPNNAEAELQIWYEDLTPVRIWNEEKQTWEINPNHPDALKEEKH